ncbi:SDR family NAD(P)-dependent oxidoreductase [Actinocrispum sp. NPDC049592]|uniref:SDR family NAD(P)-dependent oxidoreductase n=1 Tax=Actinocrispum sp. NPDC049592 TaxID=3154835 RepID=UPI0034430D47
MRWTAIVTGADRPTGIAVSSALSAAGASVVLAAEDAQALVELAAKLVAAGGHAVAVPTDLTSPISVRRLVEQTLGAFGRFDAAFNDGPVALALRYQVPPMRRAGTGAIVNLAHDQAVVDLSRSAARESGVRIEAVGPGVDVDAIVDSLRSGVAIRRT